MSAHIMGMDSITVNTPTRDINDRLTATQDPSSDSQALWQLIDDPNITVANTARGRLGLRQRPIAA